jgi:hypothetical protein
MFTTNWVTAEQFRAELGICRTTQWKLLKNGYLRPAVHFYRAGIGKKAPCCELRRLTVVYEQARLANSNRWSRSIRCWKQPDLVWINEPLATQQTSLQITLARDV